MAYGFGVGGGSRTTFSKCRWSYADRDGACASLDWDAGCNYAAFALEGDGAMTEPCPAVPFHFTKPFTLTCTWSAGKPDGSAVNEIAARLVPHVMPAPHKSAKPRVQASPVGDP